MYYLICSLDVFYKIIKLIGLNVEFFTNLRLQLLICAINEYFRVP
jgi:hypothetical protein